MNCLIFCSQATFLAFKHLHPAHRFGAHVKFSPYRRNMSVKTLSSLMSKVWEVQRNYHRQRRQSVNKSWCQLGNFISSSCVAFSISLVAPASIRGGIVPFIDFIPSVGTAPGNVRAVATCKWSNMVSPRWQFAAIELLRMPWAGTFGPVVTRTRQITTPFRWHTASYAFRTSVAGDRSVFMGSLFSVGNPMVATSTWRSTRLWNRIVSSRSWNVSILWSSGSLRNRRATACFWRTRSIGYNVVSFRCWSVASTSTWTYQRIAFWTCPSTCDVGWQMVAVFGWCTRIILEITGTDANRRRRIWSWGIRPTTNRRDIFNTAVRRCKDDGVAVSSTTFLMTHDWSKDCCIDSVYGSQSIHDKVDWYCISLLMCTKYFVNEQFFVLSFKQSDCDNLKPSKLKAETTVKSLSVSKRCCLPCLACAWSTGERDPHIFVLLRKIAGTPGNT